MAPILEIQNLQKSYGAVQALKSVDLALPDPGIYGFLGPNGAGKTTTIKIIAGLIRPTGGQVRVGGIDNSVDPVGARRHLGVMMETPQFYNRLTGKDNLRLLARVSGGGDGPRISRLIDRVGLTLKADAQVGTYSRGMRQRLGIAAALLDDPRLLILDEPTNGLDPAGIAEMRQWLSEMAMEENRAVLLSSHQMGEMERVCAHFTIIHQGMVMASGSASELSGHQSAVSVQVQNALEVQAILGQMAGITSVEILGPNRLRIDSAMHSAAEINRFLVGKGIDVIEICEAKETLEEIFFRLVGRNHDVA